MRATVTGARAKPRVRRIKRTSRTRTARTRGAITKWRRTR